MMRFSTKNKKQIYALSLLAPPMAPPPPPALVNSSNNAQISDFPLLASILATNRSINSTFRRSEVSYIISEEERALHLPKLENEGLDIIVYHPSSRNIKIGTAKDPFPKSLINVIARKAMPPHPTEPDGKTAGNEIEKPAPRTGKCFPALSDVKQGAELEAMAVHLLDNKANFIKRKSVFNATQQMLNFNKNACPIVIAGHNDAFGIEWTKLTDESTCIVSKDALYIHPTRPYAQNYPIQHRHFCSDYTIATLSLLRSDLENILVKACKLELDIEWHQLKNYHLSLILPDNINKLELKIWLQTVFSCGFKSVCIIQESLAATFGAGLGSACVLDIGAEQTTIALVEDGFLLPESRISLNYGADHLVPLFASFVNQFDFPYKELNPSNPMDFDLLTELKERTCSLNEADMSVQVIDFYVRQPGEPTLAYQFKSYEERYLTPLALFNPEWLCLSTEKAKPNVFLAYDSEEDIESLTFQRTNIPKPKALTTEEGSQLADVMNIEDNPSGIDQNAVVIENSILDSGSMKEEARENREKKNIDCKWQACAFSGDIYSLFSHIVKDHSIEFNQGYQCCWRGCGRETLSMAAFESHIVNHFMQDLNEGQNKAPKVEETKTALPLMSIDEAILKSILKVESDLERIKKWLGSILLVGGGHLFPGFSSLLEEKLRGRAKQYVNDYDKVGALNANGSSTLIRDVDPKYMSWKGGAVYSRLLVENNKEFWITSKEWYEVGMKVIVERLIHVLA